MKKRGIFSLVLVLVVLYPAFATSPFLDLGSLYELTVSDAAFADAETNSASTVTIITREQIDSFNAQTTSELVGKAIGTSFSSYGGLGAAQSVQIRGANASKTLVYMDGMLLTSAFDGVFDLSSIPVSLIERIEIVKSGAGNLGKTNAIGGIVHIITKKAADTAYPFTLAFENGSFLPLAYGTGNDTNWVSLADSQKIDFTIRGQLHDVSIVNTTGGLRALNGYTYGTGSERDIRNNADMYKVYDSLTISGDFGRQTEVNSTNFVSFQHVGVPGSLVYGLTPNDYQEDVFLSTTNSLVMENLATNLDSSTARLHYSYGRLYYHDALYGDSEHNRHKGTLMLEQVWNLGETLALSTGLESSMDYLDSSDVGQHTRITPSAYANGSIYFAGRRLSLHPTVSLSYLSDTNAFSPNASLGAIFAIDGQHVLKATVAYAENAPSFSQLYWPYMSNPDLDTEKGFNVDIGYAYSNGNVRYEGILFGRNMYNAIVNDSSWTPRNIAESLYIGTEQSITLQVNQAFGISASYQYNKSFDLSDGKSVADAVEVGNIRKHTAKASLSYGRGIVKAILDGEFLGANTESDSVLLCNLTVNLMVREHVKVYAAIDNLFNTSYAFNEGYPMPGMKIRIGGNWDFR